MDPAESTFEVPKNAAGGTRPSGPQGNDHRVRAIVFHLPQFHPIPENDEWWGKGFTEWTNVTRAKPRFPGHYQPQLPADLGFYDLRLPEARAAQAELAAEYGIYGFCYYHYWFNGRRLLERPVEEILKSGEPDFPFCLCWANENWTRRWDGQGRAVLLEQKYSAEDDLAHIRALIPMFEDRRYIQVMGKPLFAVYRASEMPEPRRTTELWRREAERAGLDGLFLVRVASHNEERNDPRNLGFDWAVDFQPNERILDSSRIERRKWWHREKLGTREPWFRENSFFEYAAFAEAALNGWNGTHQRIPCVCPGWDNSARRQTGALIVLNSSPELYERWLSEVVGRQNGLLQSMNTNNGSDLIPESLVFINAWNEWAEGNHLEPCQKWGRAYLEATRRALRIGVSVKAGDANR